MSDSSPLKSMPLFDCIGPDGRMAWQSGNGSVREVMLNILLTRRGGRLMRPEFGAGILDFINYPNNESTRALIADAAQRALRRFESRVILEEVTARADPQRLSHVNLSVRYKLRQDGSRQSFDLALELGV